MNTIQVIIEITISLVILLILYVMTLVFFNPNSIDIMVSTDNVVRTNEETKIFDGFAPCNVLSGRTFNTANNNAKNFLKIGKSLNTKGGAQFSYQFWIKIESTDANKFKNQIILMKGDPRLFKAGLYDIVTGKFKEELPKDYYVACPLIKFKNSFKEFEVKLNTVNMPIATWTIDTDNKGSVRKNALSLLPLNWYLLTFTFEDNYDYNSGSFENGIRCKFWLNDVLYAEQNANSQPSFLHNTIKDNEGELILFPSKPDANLMRIGNMKYYNYAVGRETINTVMNKGPPKTEMKNMYNLDNTSSDPSFISSYNKIDIYNY